MTRLRLQQILAGLAFVLALLTTVRSARAQLSIATDPWESAAAHAAWDLATGDLDLDGDLDLVYALLVGDNVGYLNTGGVFQQFWQGSGAANNAAQGIALGDLNGDGLLDIVIGRAGSAGAQHNEIYLNLAGTFSASPDSLIGDAFGLTSSVALGDLDNDGDLDIVFGNLNTDGSPVTTAAFENNGSGSFNQVWAADSLYDTMDVGLADVNGDGYIDLVLGNRERANALFLNSQTGAFFEAGPAWTSGIHANLTRSVALGDLNGDGAQDLVCANEDAPSTIYFNIGGVFASDPVHAFDSLYVSSGVALGDLDLDGDLDIAFSNQNQANTAYLNQGAGVFGTVPDWESALARMSTSAAMADADGDGDLDLCFTNFVTNSTVYFNQLPVLHATPGWSSPENERTLAVIAGDVNGDSGPDLVVGNAELDGIGNKLYLYSESEGTLSTTFAWNSIPLRRTDALALGDIDGDRLPDLACGNLGGTGEKNTWYRNTGTVAGFSLSESWESGPSEPTSGVALGDLNGDGLLDLVCGNNLASNTVYYNNGVDLATQPGWLSTETYRTTDVVLTDLNGDGLLDLVCANTSLTGEPNTAYVNLGAGLEAGPSWLSGPLNTTSSLIAGDVNGDGLPDVVCGNFGQANTLYLNLGVALDTQPAWSSGPTENTSDVELGDIDGDGDLDLVCAAESGGDNTLYENVGGTFALTPSWESNDNSDSRGAAIADFDRDGDLDVAFGNWAQPNTVFYGTRNPPYKGAPDAPVNQLPNNAAFVRTATVVEVSANMLEVTFDLVDVESDRVWVLPEFQFEGEPVWRDVEVGMPAVTGPQGPFDASPAGTTHSFLWNVSRVPFDDRVGNLRLRAVESSSAVSGAQFVASYIAPVGNIVPIRPKIQTSTELLGFPATTVGDTTSLSLGITNLGTADLQITAITPPSAEMRVDVTLPFTLVPDETKEFPVYINPVTELDIGGAIRIDNNDPLRQPDYVDVVTDIRDLRVATRLITSLDSIPLGQAATVIVEPVNEAHVERGWLYHRSRGEADFTAIPLGVSGNDFTAQIFGNNITEAGLEYYVEVNNEPVTSFDPAGAPGDTVFFQPVRQPKGFETEPQENSGDDFVAGLDLEVQAILDEGTLFDSGTLWYRAGGSGPFASADLTVGPGSDGNPAAVVPDSVVDASGVDYWMEIHTLTTVLRGPPATGSHRSVPIVVPDLVEPRSYLGTVSDSETSPVMKFRLLSIPLTMSGTVQASITDELGGRDIAQWRMFAREPEGGYTELGLDDRFEVGRAYWLITRERHRIGTGPDRGVTTRTDEPFAIDLFPGNNLVGHPFAFAVAWDTMGVDTLSTADAIAQGRIEAPWRWRQQTGYAGDVPVFEPFAGYWLNNLTQDTLTLYIPPIADSGAGLVPGRAVARAAGDWELRIEADARGTRDATARFGMRHGASNAWDPNDRQAPPGVPGAGISVYVPHTKWDDNPGAYAHDFRGEYVALDELTADAMALTADAAGQAWRFDVRSAADDPAVGVVSLRIEGVETVPAGAQVYLIDHELGVARDLRADATYEFFSGRTRVVDEDGARFTLVAGSESFTSARLPERPKRTVLYPNYPNPFNPSTVVRIALAEPARVEVRIYRPDGALVRTLFAGEKPAGVFEVPWDGTNGAGQRVASGVYFCRMTAGDHVQTRKMVVVK